MFHKNHPVNLNIISADASFLKVLGEELFQATVHSVFTHVINIELSNGTLYTLACRSCDNAPNTAIVDVSEFPDNWFIQGEGCVNIPGEHTLNFSRVSVSFFRSMTWECLLPAWPSGEFYLETKIALLEKTLDQQRSLVFGSHNNSEKTAQFLRAALTLLYQKANQLSDALREEKMNAATDCAVSMIGLGPGLTPSGDDFLVGFFTVLNIKNSPACRFHGLCGAVLDQAEDLTNKISLAAMKAAAHGQVRQSLVDLFNAIFDDTSHLDKAVLSRVLDIGSTSGADMLMGILYGLKHNQQSLVSQ